MQSISRSTRRTSQCVHNEIGHMGGGGVLFQGYGPGLKDVNRNNTIAHNSIHHTGTGGTSILRQ